MRPDDAETIALVRQIAAHKGFSHRMSNADGSYGPCPSIDATYAGLPWEQARKLCDCGVVDLYDRLGL